MGYCRDHFYVCTMPRLSAGSCDIYGPVALFIWDIILVDMQVNRALLARQETGNCFKKRRIIWTHQLEPEIVLRYLVLLRIVALLSSGWDMLCRPLIQPEASVAAL